MKMETLVAANENAPNIYILPGLEGTSIALEPLCKKLKAHVSCLQFCNGNDPKTIEDMALSLYPVSFIVSNFYKLACNCLSPIVT